MSLTGGELNKLNGDYGISAPDKSVPVIKLIKVHKPGSREELVKLIGKHHKERCECGILSQGSIEDFGKNLYEAQIKDWGRYKYSLRECIEWEYNLFVVQSLKGESVEKKAKEILANELSGIEIKDSNKYYDEELRVDLEIRHKDKTIAGIQVKPESYKLVRKNVHHMNKYRNSLVGFRVLYLYYDYKTEEFINLREVVEEIKKLYSLPFN